MSANPRWIGHVSKSSPRKLEYMQEYQRNYTRTHRDQVNEWHRNWKRKLRREVIEMYGGKCVCCGEKQFEFLTIDHVKGGGKADLKRFKAYFQFLLWLRKIRRKFYRVLCYNCNMARANWGTCPHGNGI